MGWFMVMTLKRRFNHPNGWVKGPQVPKKLCKFDRISRWCWQFFMLRVLFNTITFLKAPQSTRFTTLKYWNVWRTPTDAKGQNCGEVITGFSITTTLRPTQHSELVSFCPTTRSLFFPTPLTHLTLLLVTFLVPCNFLIPKTLKNASKEEDFGDQGKCDEGAESPYKRSVPGLFQEIEAPLG